MKNQIEKILKEKFGESVSFVEKRFWNECQGGSDTGYNESEVYESNQGLYTGRLFVGKTEVYENYVFAFEQEDGSWKEHGFCNEQDAECFLEDGIEDFFK